MKGTTLIISITKELLFNKFKSICCTSLPTEDFLADSFIVNTKIMFVSVL